MHANSNTVGYTYAQCKHVFLHFDLPDSPEIIPLSIPVVGQIHKPVALSCGKSIYGNPKPQLTWTYKSFLHTPLLSDNRFTVDQQTGQLLLSVTKHTDAGDYMCTAVNKIGHYSTCVTLLVLGECRFISPWCM